MRLRVAFMLALLVCPVFAGEIYSWRDKDGKIHYSDIPPPAPMEPRKIGSTGTPISAAGPSERASVADQDLEFRKRRAAAVDAESKERKKMAEAAESRDQCEQARLQLAALESGQRMARTNAAGEREFLDDAQRSGEIERSRKAVDSWCK